MSHNDSWMPLYIGDYLGDTMELDGAQHGAYLLLLMYYWRNGPLPMDDARLAQIARTDLKAWKKAVGPAVRPFFHENNGRLHQKRADIELAKAEGISTKRRAAAEARWNGHDEHPPDGRSPDANACANASDVHKQTGVQNPSKPDASGDANGMLRAPASLVHSQKQKEEREPLTPRNVGDGTPQAGAPPRSRSSGNNPRKTGENPRANGTNPRANGTNPRAVDKSKPRFTSGAIELIYNEGIAAKEARDKAEFDAFVAAKGLRYGSG